MQNHPEFRNWARTHIFRVSTALVTLLLLGLCFFYRPELLTWWLRTTMGLIETGSGLLPYPWGDRFEIALRGIGGSFWFQITLAIILVRVLAWLIAACWRRRPSRSRLKTEVDRARQNLDRTAPPVRGPFDLRRD
jgi:hypothetical protein